MMIINVDVDGVIRDFMSATIDVYKKHYDKDCKVTHDDITEYFFNKTLPLITGDYHTFYKKYPKEIFEDAKPYSGELCSLDFLKSEGNTINIVTKQPKGLEKYTLNWLEQWKVPYDSLMFAQDKNLIIGDILVDDYIGNLKNYKVGFPICLKRPWNSKWKGISINSLSDLIGKSI